MIEIYLRFWITGFNPKMVPGTVHHMAVAGCSERPPRTDHNVWNCEADREYWAGDQDISRPVYLLSGPVVKEWTSLYAT